jgi:hypothetical protein
MLLDYHFSLQTRRWHIVCRETGDHIATFTLKCDITDHFMPEILNHETEKCECCECEDARDDLAIDEGCSVAELHKAGDWTEGGYGDSFA